MLLPTKYDNYQTILHWEYTSICRTLTCNKKLKKTATPAYNENALTAGIVEIAPSKNAADSEVAVSNSEGATSDKARPIKKSTLRSGVLRCSLY